MRLPDFRPYDVPLDLPITGPMQCQLCKHESVGFIALMAFDGQFPWVGFGCGACTTRWLYGPRRDVTYSGLNVVEAREARRDMTQGHEGYPDR